MRKLSGAQRKALEDYHKLRAEKPHLFRARNDRPLITDNAEMARYSAEAEVVLGVVLQTRYFLVLNDLVRSPKSIVHPYLRIVSKASLEGSVNVVVFATLQTAEFGLPGSVVLVEQERHALGTRELELPRGFGELGQDGPTNAMRELCEETGFIGTSARHLGTIATDSGLTDSLVAFFHIEVDGRVAPSPEHEEAIARVRLFSRDELRRAIASGQIRDGFTLQACALFAALRGKDD